MEKGRRIDPRPRRGAWGSHRRAINDGSRRRFKTAVQDGGSRRWFKLYVGITTVQVGIGIAFNLVWISLLAALSLATIHFIAVVPEEAYLSQKFGDSYRAYLTRVRRYL
jgi:protein-S-isoprenylcysteine O-methyltransferase Ste14